MLHLFPSSHQIFSALTVFRVEIEQYALILSNLHFSDLYLFAIHNLFFAKLLLLCEQSYVTVWCLTPEMRMHNSHLNHCKSISRFLTRWKHQKTCFLTVSVSVQKVYIGLRLVTQNSTEKTTSLETYVKSIKKRPTVIDLCIHINIFMCFLEILISFLLINFNTILHT